MPTQILALRKRMRVLLVVVSAIVMVTGNLLSVYAADLASASLELGDPRTGETTSYTFSASGFSGTALECITLELDSQADGAGGVPSNIDSTSATLDSSTLITAGSWTQDSATNGLLEITNLAGEVPAANGNIVWDGIVNGDTEEDTYYGIFNTYSDDACTAGVDSVVVAFIYNDGELVSLNINVTLNFQIKSVTSGSTINGATTNTDSTASGIDFGLMTTASNDISAHDLEVATNAAGGWTVYIRQSQTMQNSTGGTLEWTSSPGSNDNPVAFPAAGTEAWGYTTDDDSLSGLTPDRFTSSGGNKWAAFNTSNEEVFYSNAASAGVETARVGQQVGISSDTGAGAYQTTIIYTIVASY